MNLRLVLCAVPALAGPLIFWLFLKSSGLTAAELGAQAALLRPLPVLVIVAATAAHLALAGEKWRLVESRFAASKPSRWNAVAYSAIGTALGQFLPPPLANALIRGAGNRLAAGAGARRGALTSIWEQLFDLGVIAVLCLPAAASLVLLSPAAFLVGAAAAALAAGFIVGPFVERLALTARLPAPLRDRALTVSLYRLSLARFALLTVITLSVPWAMGAPIDPLQLASVIPPVALGSVLSFLPAGVGVNEWSFVVLLGHWGIGFGAVAAFAAMNRIVVGLTALAWGLVAALAMSAGRERRAIARPAVEVRPFGR